MLNFMRRHAKGLFVKVIFWMIIAVFVLWGVGSFDEGEMSYAATVNGGEVSARDLRRLSQQLEQFYRQLYGDNFSPEMAKALDFPNRALEQMINRALLLEEAERLGLTVTEDEVRQSIAKIEGLRNEKGEFNREI